MKKLLIVFFAALCSFFLGTMVAGEEKLPSLVYAQATQSDFASCKFTKGDQNPKDEPYQSPLLLSYFKEVSEKTGVPATVLAGIARVESTTGRYTISHYTDGDIREMEDTAKSLQNIDDVIGRSTKARCPRSPTGALGLMQIQPPRQVHDIVRDQLTENGDSQIPTFDKVGAHDGEAVTNGIRIAIAAGALPAGTTVDKLTIEDFCNPKRNLYLSAGFILKKMQREGFGDGAKWDASWNTNKTYFDAVASSYYGCLKYPSCSAGPNSYGDDLWASSQSCKADIALSPADTTLPFVNFISESNVVTTRVGNPTEQTTGGGIVSCPLKGKRVIGCGSFMSDPKFNRGVCLGPQPINRGHCGTNYGCYKGSVEATNASRRSHSIDVDAPSGETVYLPTINGQSVTWSSAPYLSYPVAAGDGGGYGHVFVATVGSDKWLMHLLHMNPPPLIPVPAGRSEYQSGDAVTTVAATGYPHLHINIGRNPETNNGGAGWLNPEDLGMCTE